MNNPDELLIRMNKTIQHLGAVWKLDFADEEFSILEPGGPYYTEEELVKAEQKLGIKLPLEYRIFINNYGFATFLWYEIMMIVPEIEGEEIKITNDLISRYFLYIKKRLLKERELCFMDAAENGMFFFRCEPIDSEKESSSQVYRIYGEGGEDEPVIVASSLMDLFSKWVIESDAGRL